MVTPASTRAPPGTAALLVIKGNASSRCGISMKGIDIIVHGNIGHMSAFMGQSGNMVVLGDAGDALGDSCTRPVFSCAVRSNPLAPIASKRKCAPSIWKSWQNLLERGQCDAKPEEFTPLRLCPQALQFRRRQPRVLRSLMMKDDHKGVSAHRTHPVGDLLEPDSTATSAAPRPPASMTFAAAGPSASCRHFDDLLFIGASISRYPSKGTARNAIPR